MTTLLHRTRAWFAATIADNRSVAEEAIMGNIRRMQWLVLAVVPLNLIHVVLFWWVVVAQEPTQVAWKDAIGWAHLAMAAWLVLVGVGAYLLARQERPGLSARLMHLLAPLSALVFTAVLSTIDQQPEDRHALTRKLGPFKTSMLQDVEAHRAVELDALVSAVRELGALTGVPTKIACWAQRWCMHWAGSVPCH